MVRFSALMCMVVMIASPGCTQHNADDGSAGTRSVMVEVDGHQVHLMIRGPRRAPVVVLENGMGNTHESWDTLPQLLARDFRVAYYDRPGYGASETCERTRDANIISAELREVLQRAGIDPPYLFVGWSYGGAISRVYASRWPAEVAGVVLIDPAQPAFYNRARAEFPAEFRRLDSLDLHVIADGTVGERAEAAAWDMTMLQVNQADRDLSLNATLLASSRDELGSVGAVWREEQERWAAERPAVEFQLVPNAPHAIHRARPDLVLQALEQLHSGTSGSGRRR